MNTQAGQKGGQAGSATTETVCLIASSLIDQTGPLMPSLLWLLAGGAGDLDLEDLQFEARPYDVNTVYKQSKQVGREMTRRPLGSCCRSSPGKGG